MELSPFPCLGEGAGTEGQSGRDALTVCGMLGPRGPLEFFLLFGLVASDSPPPTTWFCVSLLLIKR